MSLGAIKLTGKGLQMDIDAETVTQIKNVLAALKTVRKAEATTELYTVTASSYQVHNTEDRNGKPRRAITITIIEA